MGAYLFQAGTEVPVASSVVGAGSLIKMQVGGIKAFSARVTLDDPSATIFRGGR